MKKKSVVLKAILLSLAPAVCAYLSQSDNILFWLQEKKYLGENVDIDFFRNCMSVLSIVLTFVLLTVPFAVSEYKSKEYLKQRDALIRYYREIFEITLRNELKLKHCRFMIRIFVPKITLLYRVRKLFHFPNKLEYHIKNVEGLADKDITENLKLRVYPEQQGLVGLCYKDKAMIYDCDLEHSNGTSYMLNKHQIAKTNKLKFALACPIFSENEEIVAIVSIDSNDDVKIDAEAKDVLRNLVLNYTQSLYDCIPEFFKPKGGIL